MRKKYNDTKGFGVLVVVVLVLIIAVVGTAGWVVSRRTGNKEAKNTPTANTDNAQITQATTYQKESTTARQADVTKRTESGGYSGSFIELPSKGFGFVIPDGWKDAVLDTTGSFLISSAAGTVYTKGVLPKVTEVDGGGTDGVQRFTIWQFKDGDQYRILDGDESREPFNTSLLKGTKYYKHHSEDIDPVTGYPGYKSYIYEFKTPGKMTYITYNVKEKSSDPNSNFKVDEPNDSSFIDQVVRTLQIS